MSKDTNKEAMTWLQFNNVFPVLVTLITTTFSVATIYYKLNSKVDLAIQKLDYIALKIDEHLQENEKDKLVHDRHYQELTEVKGEVNLIKYQLKIK